MGSKESQGVQIRRASSVSVSKTATGLNFRAATTDIVNDNATADFSSAGFTSAMRVQAISSNNTAIKTIKSVAATVMTFHEPVTDQDAITLSITGYTMNPIGEILSFNGPTGSANVIDITHLGSTAKEKMMGLRDEGQLSFSVLWDNADSALHNLLMKDRSARTKRCFDIVFNDANTIASYAFFKAYVTGFSISGAVDNVIKADVTLEISTEVHWQTAI